MLFLTTGFFDLQSKSCAENDQTMIDHEGSAREKRVRIAEILMGLVPKCEMEVDLFASDVEENIVTNNNSEKTLCNDVIDNIQNKLRLCGESSKLTTWIGAYDTHVSLCVDDVPIRTDLI